MALSSSRNILLRLPPSTALLLISTIFGSANSHALPRQTKTVEYHELNVAAWPPAPTSPPLANAELLRRQEFNTICGYIGGDQNLPATCLAGSHCVLDQEHGAIGCCPNGGSCTVGVFTSCVDFNSGPQTVVNPYVYTCAGSDVCYKNTFDGGFIQYGCGTATDLATSVHISPTGISSAPQLSSVSVPFTQTPSSLSAPITINPSTGTRSFTRPASSSQRPSSASISESRTPTSQPLTSQPSTGSSGASSIISSSISSSISSALTSSQSSSTTVTSQSSSRSIATPTISSAISGTGSLVTGSPSPVSSDGGTDKTGAIVGGTVAGVAVLVAAVALGVFFCRKRRNNARQGPGPAPTPQTTEYFSPMRSHGAAFAPLPTWQEEDENHYHSQPNSANHLQHQQQPYYGGTTTEIRGGQGVPVPMGYNSSHYDGGDIGTAPMPNDDRVPLTRELNEFTSGFNDALARIDEHPDSRPQTGGHYMGQPEPVSSIYESQQQERTPSRDGHGPLWQQNRRQSRNLMWM